MSNICILILMTTSEISRMVVDMPTADKAELTRLARERHDRGMGPMVRIIVREWIAAEQAAEAAENASAA